MAVESKDEPLRMLEDAGSGQRFVVYTTKNGVRLDLRFDGEQPWFTQANLAEMYGVTVPTVNEHLKKFLEDGELDESVIRKFRITARDGKTYDTNHYGLDAAFYVGYRVNSREGVLFRRWATDMLVQLATKGFVIDVERLENPDGRPDFFDELLDKIRHIRASEKRMWTRIMELASFCSDYHVMGKTDKENFFAAIQNAMHWAVTQETAAEVIYHRANASKPNAGVTHFKGEMPTAEEAKVAKNYYSEGEINALNILTSAVLEFFASQAEQRRPTTLNQFLGKMREFIKLDGRPLIPAGHTGFVKMTDAKQKASGEIAVYQEKMRLAKEAAGEKAVVELLAQAKHAMEAKRQKKKLPPSPRRKT